MREGGIRDLAVLRAMEAISRAQFVAPEYAGLAGKDVALPIACGQTCPTPLDTARILQAAELGPNMRVLEAGTGSGYATALLAGLVERVVSVERYRTLVQEAKQRLASLGHANVSLQWADALDLPPLGEFDRLIIHGVLHPLPPTIWRHVAEGGSIIHAAWDAGRRAAILRRTTKNTGGEATETLVGPVRLGALVPGLPVRL